MRQKLFLLFLVGFLITAPTLADVAVPADPTNPAGTSGFGESKATAQDIVSNDDFTLTVDAEVFYDKDNGVYTYVYDLTLEASDPAVTLDQFSILNGLFNDQAWGWVGLTTIAPLNPDGVLGPFTLPVSVGLLQTDFFFGNFSDPPPDPGHVTIFIKSDLAWKDAEYFFGVGSGEFAPTEGLGETLAPALTGGGAGGFSVPEPSSLILLSFGLLSGGVFRFSTRRTRG